MSEITQTPVAVFTAVPPLRSPTVALKKGVAYGRGPRGDGAEYGNIKFNPGDGSYECFDEEIAEALRKHDGNVARGGHSFSEVPKIALETARALVLPAVQAPEDGLTDEDRDLLSRLDGYCKNIPPKALDAARELYSALKARFQVSGDKAPRDQDSPSIVRVRLLDLREMLSEAGIPPEPVSDEG